MPGFDAAKRFVLLDHRPGSIFRWLQAVDFPKLAFVVIDPLLAEPSYPLSDVRRQLDLLDLALNEAIIVLGICTVPPAPELPTVNLMAPLGIGVTSKIGAQVILHDRPFSARQEFMTAKAA